MPITDSIHIALAMVSSAVRGRTPFALAGKQFSPPIFANKQQDDYTSTLARAEAVLNLHKSYTLADAKKTWKLLCVKFHPDKGLYPDGKLFRRVKDAFEIVQDHLSMSTLVEVEHTTTIIELLTIGCWQSLQTQKIYKFVKEGEQLMVEYRGWWREPVDLCYNKVIKTGESKVCGPFHGTVLRREIKSPDPSKGLGVFRFTNNDCWVQLDSPPPAATEWSFKDLELGNEDADVEDVVLRLLQEGLWKDDDSFEWVFRRQRFRKRHLNMWSKDLQDLICELEIVQGQLLFQFHDDSDANVAVMRMDNDGKPVIVHLENEFGFFRSTPSKSMLGLRGSSKRKRGTRAGKSMQAKHARH